MVIFVWYYRVEFDEKDVFPMKILLAILLCTTMLLSMAACKAESPEATTTAPPQTSVPTTVPDPTETDAPGSDGVPIEIVRSAEEGAAVRTTGIVAKITYSYGMKPSGFILTDHSGSIYVYGADIAGKVKEGNTVTVSGTKTYWILEDEESAAEKFGYLGCSQIENAVLEDNDNGNSPFPTDGIQKTTVKAIMDTPVSEDITTKVYQVTALVKKVEGTGFTNYYINDLDGTTGSYVYTQCSGSDFSWLDEFDGKICTVYLTALNAKSASSGCFWRLLPIKVVDEGFDISTVNIAEHVVKYYGIPQFQASYSGDPAQELTASVSSELLNFTDAAITYSSDNEAVASVNDGVLHCLAAGTANITVSCTYNGESYSETVTVTVTENEVVEYIDVSTAISTEVGQTVTVKGIVGPSLVNRTGFYLIDESGIIAITTDEATMETLNIGDEVILTGLRDKFHNGKGDHAGQTAITNCTVVSNSYGDHDYCTDFFIEGKTLTDFYNLDVTVDHSTSVYVVKATVQVEESAYYTRIKLTDGSTSVSLYCSSANQYKWLQSYAGQEVTLELAPCNWNNKTYWAGCVLAVRTDDGKVVNELNFG